MEIIASGDIESPVKLGFLLKSVVRDHFRRCENNKYWQKCWSHGDLGKKNLHSSVFNNSITRALLNNLVVS